MDIKPENFRIGHDKIVKILDFGLVMDYNVDGKHKDFGKFNFNGSPVWASLNAHQEFSLSRRDDLESLGYSYLYLIGHQFLPWLNIQDQKEIEKCKREFESKLSKKDKEQIQNIIIFIKRA